VPNNSEEVLFNFKNDRQAFTSIPSQKIGENEILTCFSMATKREPSTPCGSLMSHMLNERNIEIPQALSILPTNRQSPKERLHRQHLPILRVLLFNRVGNESYY